VCILVNLNAKAITVQLITSNSAWNIQGSCRDISGCGIKTDDSTESMFRSLHCLIPSSQETTPVVSAALGEDGARNGRM
jgi:hypothetical protein